MRVHVVGGMVGLGLAVLGMPAVGVAQHQEALVAIPMVAAASQDVIQSQQKSLSVEQRRVTLTLSNVTLVDAIQAIADKARLTPTYPSNLIPTKIVSLRVTDLTVTHAFAKVLEGTGLRVDVQPSGIVGILKSDQASENGTVTGRVVHASTKEPLAGVRITVNGSSTSAVSGPDGTFRLVLEPGSHTVNIRGVGFGRQSRDITVAEGKIVTLEVGLEPNASVLNEVIVTGTVVATERREVATPITVIKAEDIQRRGITRIDQLFRGEVPGVMALEEGNRVYGSTLGQMASSRVYVRGASAFSPEVATPLKTYLDGVELLDPTYLGTIDPQTIERIEIVTGPQAATIYGSGASGGVMQIFTKKGTHGTPEVSLHVKYGILESDFSDGKTPSHHDVINVTGNSGPEFSYSANISYNYTGQWQPMLFNRRYGAQIGMMHRKGPVGFQGSVSLTRGTNGTHVSAVTPFQFEKRMSGEWHRNSYGLQVQQRVSGASSQILGFTLDYQPTTIWQHQIVVGRSQNEFQLIPQSPVFKTPSDSVFYTEESKGQRISFNYNSNLVAPRLGWFSSTVSFGMNRSQATQRRMAGGLVDPEATSYVSPFATRVPEDKNSGGFISWRLGVADAVFFSLGLRAERNPRYGDDHPTDWTPTTGVTYTLQTGEATLKLLASYGRATRPPAPDQRNERISYVTNYEPNGYYPTYLAAPLLTPEYERGPQGGFEFYYGNIGSLAVNTYNQRVSDLILPIYVDSIQLSHLSPNDHIAYWWKIMQNQNIATIQKRGWEGTGTLNLGPVGMRAVYSWNDSRVLRLNGGITTYVEYVGSRYQDGGSFMNVPSHTGSVTMTYARGNTTISFVTNWVGRVPVRYVDGPFWSVGADIRLRTYADLGRTNTEQYVRSGYAKSDLALIHRFSSRINGTVNVTNIGNSYASQSSYSYGPALGRQTLFGLSVRWP